MVKKKYILSPSILSADFTQLGNQMKQAEDAGADWFHIDVMDGHFVPNISMGPHIVNACKTTTDLPLDVHLMIEEPERYLEKFAAAGASSLTVHIETCPDMDKTQKMIRDLGCKVGITLNPGTSEEKIQPYLENVDLVLVMCVHPGYSGQSFLPEVLPKIGRIRKILDKINPDVQIEVDGGINHETINQTYKQGARIFVAASAIFKHPQGIQAGIESLTDKL